MIEAYKEALHFLCTPTAMGWMLIGTVVSIIGGIIPGITAKITIVLFIPFILLFPRDIALLILVALQSASVTGGSITAILINIPGTNINAATLLDGFPMTRKGEGNRAIGAAVTASMMGGAIPVFLALAMIPLLLPILMAFQAPEMAILVIGGMTCVAMLTPESTTRGLASAALGVLISLVGYQGSTGVSRFTFGSMFLYDGFSIATFALGLFGLAEMFDMKLKGEKSITNITLAQTKLTGLAQTFQGARDVWHHRWLWLRSTLIGYVVGLIPGIGGEVAIWVAYAQAKYTSKNPELFGTGCVEGVIAPESANNAKESGALLTTMAFGIPGSGLMALFIGAFLMVGVVPGPKMLTDHLPLALTLLLGIVICNVLGGIICFFSAPFLTIITRIHMDYVFSAILCVIFIAAYAVEESLLNIVVVVGLGVFGLIMKRFKFSRPALLLGFVLGGMTELYTLRSIRLYGTLFFMRPICLILIAIIIGAFCYPYIKRLLLLRTQKQV